MWSLPLLSNNIFVVPLTPCSTMVSLPVEKFRVPLSVRVELPTINLSLPAPKVICPSIQLLISMLPPSEPVARLMAWPLLSTIMPCLYSSSLIVSLPLLSKRMLPAIVIPSKRLFTKILSLPVPVEIILPSIKSPLTVILSLPPPIMVVCDVLLLILLPIVIILFPVPASIIVLVAVLTLILSLPMPP